MDNKAKILEVFQSIQGEGLYAGVKQVFIRFFECNMHCVWCDTPHSIGDTSQKYEEYTTEQLSQVVDQYRRGCHSLSLTGGEPLIQADFIKSFLGMHEKTALKIYLETNGTLPDELEKIIDEVDIIAMDMKMPSSTKQKEFWSEHEASLDIALQSDSELFVKIVVSADTEQKDLNMATTVLATKSKRIPLIIQPNTFDLKNGVAAKCQEFQDYALRYLDDVRVIPQMHHYLKLR